jgi:DNA-binding NarL/FixJ family response regulator
MACKIETEKAFSAKSACVERENETGSIRIWLVDDNAGFRGLLASMLNSEVGFECSRQFAYPAALLGALADEIAPDVILLDIQMGAYNGLDAIGSIKALAPGTHVLMLTTFENPESRARAFREGASDFMLKSWTMNEMAAHIRRAMEFGSVAGLLTTFFGKPVVKSEPAQMVDKSWAERWLVNMRGMVKLIPS